MGRGPILACAALTGAVGVAMLTVGEKVEGLVWLAVPIVALSVILFAFVFRAKPSSPAEGAQPGGWYPFAILGIAAALGSWAIYWAKFR